MIPIPAIDLKDGRVVRLLHGDFKEEKILNTAAATIQVGGGIRTIENIRLYLEMGARWVVLGTRASMDAGFLKEVVKEYGEKVIVGIDARDGFVATEGWTKITDARASDLAKSVETFGGETIIYTDISKDGALGGPNLREVESLCGEAKLQVIASGGVASLKDIEALLALKRKNLMGVIIGKALYENKFDLKDALKTCLRSG